VGKLTVDDRRLAITFELEKRRARLLFEGHLAEIEESLRELGFQTRINVGTDVDAHHPLLADVPILDIEGSELDVVA
jgi:hypothetical protein